MPRKLTHWLKTYCHHTAGSEAPLDFHFWTGVSTIAGALRRRVWKDELYYKWTPNFYIIFVGPAGVVTKSTTLNLGFKLLRRVPGVHFGPDSMTWHGLAKDFETAVEYVEYTNGAGKKQTVLMSPLTCSVSELGTFLRPDDRALVSFLTDVWDGKERPFKHDTKDSGNIEIQNAWLNIIGATTPEWMTANFPPGMLSEGLGSRIIFVYGDTKRHLSAYPSQRIVLKDFLTTEDVLVNDLEHISKMAGPYELTKEAYAWGEAWYDRHHSTRSTTMASSRYGGYLARKQTHLHKLAMVLAASQRDALVIEKGDLEAAEQILSSTEGSMIRVFESVGVVDEVKQVAEIVAFVRAHKWLTSRDLYRLCHNIMSKKDFTAALHAACESDLLEVSSRGGQLGVQPKTGTMH